MISLPGGVSVARRGCSERLSRLLPGLGDVADRPPGDVPGPWLSWTTTWTTWLARIVVMPLAIQKVRSCTGPSYPQVRRNALTNPFVGFTLVTRLTALAGLGGAGCSSGGLEATAGVAVDHAFGRKHQRRDPRRSHRGGFGRLQRQLDLSTARSRPLGYQSSQQPKLVVGQPLGRSEPSPGAICGVLQRAFPGLTTERVRAEHPPAEVPVGPAYASVVKSMTAQAAFGKALYGRAILKPHVMSLDVEDAVVRDCQDTSRSGVEDVKTGRNETGGIPRTLVVTNMHLSEGTWRISKIDYRDPSVETLPGRSQR